MPFLRSVVAAVLLAVLPHTSSACERPDSDFNGFFDRFSTEPSFQLQRMAERVRFGHYRGEVGKERMIWREYSPERLQEKLGPSYLPDVKDRETNYLVRLGPRHKTHRVVEIAKQESDAFVVTLYFTKTSGCWRLYGVKDESNVQWKD